MNAARMEEIETSAEPAASGPEAPDDRVVGERGIGSINKVRSLQSRVSNVLAVGLLSVLAVGVPRLVLRPYVLGAARRAGVRAVELGKEKRRATCLCHPWGRSSP